MIEEGMHKGPPGCVSAHYHSSGSDAADVVPEAELKRRKVAIKELKQRMLLGAIRRTIEESNPLHPGAIIAEIKQMLSKESESEDDTVAGESRITLPQDMVVLLFE